MNDPVIEALHSAIRAKRLDALTKIKYLFNLPIEFDSADHLGKTRQAIQDYDESIKPILEHINQLKGQK